MKRIDQNRTRDCLRSCVAFILGLPWWEVPNFVGRYRGRWEWHLAKWLERRGLMLVGCDRDLRTRGDANHAYIAVGLTRRNSSHAIVKNRGVCVYDPNPSGPRLRHVTRSYLLLPQERRER